MKKSIRRGPKYQSCSAARHPVSWVHWRRNSHRRDDDHPVCHDLTFRLGAWRNVSQSIHKKRVNFWHSSNQSKQRMQICKILFDWLHRFLLLRIFHTESNKNQTISYFIFYQNLIAKHCQQIQFTYEINRQQLLLFSKLDACFAFSCATFSRFSAVLKTWYNDDWWMRIWPIIKFQTPLCTKRNFLKILHWVFIRRKLQSNLLIQFHH